MIGYVKGILLEKIPPVLVVDVCGLGYEIFAPMSVFYGLPKIGDEVCIYTHFVVREDAHLLYGFHNKAERGLFRGLIKVNGVGPKMALAILSGMELNDFIKCIAEGDKVRLVNIPGVGKKTAERLIIEMQDRLKEWQTDEGNDLSRKDLVHRSGYVNTTQIAVDEAVNALMSLGYKQKEAVQAVGNPTVEGVAITSEVLIRRALQKMNQ